MTDPRDRAPDEPLEPTDEEPLDQALDDVTDGDDGVANANDDEAPIDDADIDAIEGELVDDAEDEAIEADEAGIDDYEAALREVAGEEVPATTPPAERRPSARRRVEARTGGRAPSPSEIAVHVREDWSRAFVILAVAVFVVILLNGLLLGTGGLLRPLPTPIPSPTASPSGSPSASSSPAASDAPSPAAS